MSHIRIILDANPGEVEQMLLDIRKNVTPNYIWSMPMILDFRVYRKDEKKLLNYFAQYAYLDDTGHKHWTRSKIMAWLIREVLLLPHRLLGYKRPPVSRRKRFSYDRKLHQALIIGVKKDRMVWDRELLKQGIKREVEER